MSPFSRRAKAEAAKYQHQIHPKHRHKYNFGSGCGAGEQGNKGFQPGNTCGGDGDGKNDAGDQGGGDKSSMWNNLDRFSDQEIGRMVADNAPELEKDDLEKRVAEGKKRGLIRDEVTAENILEQPGFADDAPAADDEQAKRDAEIADLQKQIAEQQSAMDAEIAENYKDVTEEDIQDMLDEKDITAAEAEEMRGWVAQAQEAQADAPAAGDAGVGQEYADGKYVPVEVKDNLGNTLSIDTQYDEIDGTYVASYRSGPYTKMMDGSEVQSITEVASGSTPEEAANQVLEKVGKSADAPAAADAGATIDVSEASGSGGGYEAQLPTGYEISHAGYGEKPWQITGEKAGGRSYSFDNESNAEIGSMALALAESSSNYDHLLLDDESNLQAFASYVTDYMGEYKDVTASQVEDYLSYYEDQRIGQYEGGIAEYASQLIDDMGGAKEAMGDRASVYIDYDKWNEELDSVDEGYGFREVEGGYEVYDRQEEEVEPTFYEFGHEAEDAAKEINNDILEEMVDMGTSHPSGESYAERYLDVSGWAKDLETNGDIVDLGDGHLVWGG